MKAYVWSVILYGRETCTHQETIKEEVKGFQLRATEEFKAQAVENSITNEEALKIVQKSRCLCNQNKLEE